MHRYCISHRIGILYFCGTFLNKNREHYQKVPRKHYGTRGRMAHQGIQKKTLVIAVFFSFICGFLAGAGFAVFKSPSPALPVPASGGTDDISNQQAGEITSLVAQLATNPTNFQLWTQLGNLYYDTGQPEKAIEAYNRSLELHTGDANLLTDLGVMYRRISNPQKAIEFFDRAIVVDPRHEQSRVNKGIVLLYDLHEPDQAIATWEDLLRIDPKARTANGETIRELIDQIKAKQEDKK